MTITNHRAKVAGRMPCKRIARLLTFEEERRNEEFFACQAEIAARRAADLCEILSRMEREQSERAETETTETIQ